jgi:hypothetical protein
LNFNENFSFPLNLNTFDKILMIQNLKKAKRKEISLPFPFGFFAIFCIFVPFCSASSSHQNK